MPWSMAARAAVALLVIILTPVLSHAQEKQPPQKAPAMDHGARESVEKWKELDGFHMQLMMSWHAAKDRNDLGPIRARVGDLVQAAKALAESRAPTACQKPALLKVQAELPVETEKVAGLVRRKVSDDELKTALGVLHDKFEVLGEGCNTGMMMKHG